MTIHHGASPPQYNEASLSDYSSSDVQPLKQGPGYRTAIMAVSAVGLVLGREDNHDILTYAPSVCVILQQSPRQRKSQWRSLRNVI